MEGIEVTIEKYTAPCQDQFNYAARYGSTQCNQIQAVLELDRHLDLECLQKALQLVFKTEPVLACRFVEAEHTPYWEPIPDFDPLRCFSIRETGEPEKAVQDCLVRPMDLDYDPGMQLELIRTPLTDRLVLKVNHACTDGNGVKSLVQLLTGIYTQLETDPDYRPVTHGWGNRYQAQLFEELGISNLETAFDPQRITPQANWAFPHYPGEPVMPNVSLRRLTVAQFKAIAQMAKQTGAGINNVILAAFYRAISTMLAFEEYLPLEIMVTVDLRQYLANGKTDALCNLSGSVNARITRSAGESFRETLLRVIPVMTELKQHRLGVQMNLFFELMSRMGFRQMLDRWLGIQQAAKTSGISAPMLSNLGVISPEPLQFGACNVRDAYIVTPPLCAPAFMLGVSTYQEVLTLAVNYYEPVTRRGDVERFLDLVVRELAGLERE